MASEIDLADSSNSRVLNNRDLRLNWTIDWENEEVTFVVENAFTPSTRYFIFGFSKWEDVNNSDYCLFDRDNATTALVSIFALEV